MAKITPCAENGKATVVPEVPGYVCFGSTEFHTIRPEQGVRPDGRLGDVVITKYGEPAVELVRCRKRRGGIDFDKLEADCRRLGIEEASPEEAAAWKADFEDPAFSRKVLGLDDDE